MQAMVPLCCAEGIFERYTGVTDIVSSGLELSGVAFWLAAADQIIQIGRVHAALTSCFR
jgi:hypothetical protein